MSIANKDKVEMNEQLIKLRRKYEEQKQIVEESRRELEEKYPEVFKEEGEEEKK